MLDCAITTLYIKKGPGNEVWGRGLVTYKETTPHKSFLLDPWVSMNSVAPIMKISRLYYKQFDGHKTFLSIFKILGFFGPCLILTYPMLFA